MNKTPSSTFILDQLAEGKTFDDLRREYGFRRIDLVTAALYGITELREEYLTLIARRRRAH